MRPLKQSGLGRLLRGAFAAAAVLLLFPVAYNPTLRSDYVRLLAHWRAKLVRPRFVLIGDSITAGGGASWGWRLAGDPLAAINLGVGGYTTRQVVDLAEAAAKYRARYLVFTAGTNDATSPLDAGALSQSWQLLLQRGGDASLIVTLAPLTLQPQLNARIGEIDKLETQWFAARGAKLVDLNPLLAPEGLIKRRYTTDGVHFSDDAYRVWAREIVRAEKPGMRQLE